MLPVGELIVAFGNLIGDIIKSRALFMKFLGRNAHFPKARERKRLTFVFPISFRVDDSALRCAANDSSQDRRVNHIRAKREKCSCVKRKTVRPINLWFRGAFIPRILGSCGPSFHKFSAQHECAVF